MGEGQLVRLRKGGIFSLQQAEKILPIISRFTYELRQTFESLTKQLKSLSGADYERRNALEEEILSLVDVWQTKVTKLGAHPKGLWLVDFDSGDGYFCWKFPEDRLLFWHGYSEGFSNRILIADYLKSSPETKSPFGPLSERDGYEISFSSDSL